MVSDTIQFIYNNKIFKIKNPNPNQTILDFIRSDLKKTGTKEGCAEGGCGACTIVLGELKNQRLIYKSINSCISFLPIINGKHLILIENLTSNNKLHPIQEAMVKFHGSQCGFCTPGFVMSLFAMYKNFSKFNDETIDETLSGNLCRCTGYRPIIDAAKSLNYKSDNDHFKKDEKNIIKLLKKIKDKDIEISYEDKKYFAPKTLLSLKKILKKNSNMKFLSGGTDLSLEVTKQRGDIKNMISLNSIKELKFIKKTKNFIEIGSGVSLYEFQNIIKSYYPDFYNILKRYGSVQIRNVGTLAGNIATASPIGDSLPLLLSLDSLIKIKTSKFIEKALTNSTFSEDTFLKAQKLISEDFSPIDDMRASKNYRVDVAKNLIMKFFYEVSSQKKLRVIS